MTAGASDCHIVSRGAEKALLLKGEWSPRHLELMLSQNIKALVVSGYAGWRGTSLDFLRSAPFLERLELLVTRIPDPSVLYELHALRYLSVDGNKDPVDFSLLPSLETVALGGWKQESYESLFDSSGLRKVVLTALPEQYLPRLSNLPRLENLSLTFCRFVSSEGIGALPGLTRLSLMRCRRLMNLSGLERCPNIAVLWIEQAPALQDIGSVSRLLRLRTLVLKECPKVASLHPLSGLAELETVGLMQTTNVRDGDLSPLLTLPKLRNATFLDRRHYTHRRAEFPKELPAFY